MNFVQIVNKRMHYKKYLDVLQANTV